MNRILPIILSLLAVSVSAEIIPAERLHPWQDNVGVVGGIPTRTNIWLNVLTTTNELYRCAADGVTDNKTALWACIIDCPEDQVIYLPAGTYYISDRVYWAAARRFVIRGAGPDKTTIVSPSLHFTFGSAEYPMPTVRCFLGADATKGATSLMVTNGGAFAAGQMWALDCLNDTNMVMTQNSCYDLDGDCTRSIINMIYVTNVVGNTVYFQRPLVWNFTTALGARLSLMTDVNHAPTPFITERIGIENLRLSHGGTVPDGQPHIDFSHAKDCWLYNVHFDEINRYAVMFDQSMDCTMEHCTMGPGQVVGVPNRGYGIWAWHTSYMLAQDNIAVRLTAPFVFATSVGGVCAYNFSTNIYAGGVDPALGWMGGDFTMGHGPHSMFNLVEGNIGSCYQPDNYYGSASHLTAFRNYFRGMDTNTTRNMKAVDVQSWVLTNNIVGNVLGADSVTWTAYEVTNQIVDIIGGVDKVIFRTGYANMGNDSLTGWDERPGQSMLRHGNLDRYNDAVNWDAGIADHDLPASLWLTNKPSWWGNARWPAIDPTNSTPVSAIPAQLRYEGVTLKHNATISRATLSGRYYIK